jgi:hypothetical protein
VQVCTGVASFYDDDVRATVYAVSSIDSTNTFELLSRTNIVYVMLHHASPAEIQTRFLFASTANMGYTGAGTQGNMGHRRSVVRVGYFFLQRASMPLARCQPEPYSVYHSMPSNCMA